MACKFELAWRGACNADTIVGSDYCSEHLDLPCVSCAKQATHECEEIVGTQLCSTKLCDQCSGALLFMLGEQTHQHKKILDK